MKFDRKKNGILSVSSMICMILFCWNSVVISCVRNLVVSRKGRFSIISVFGLFRIGRL